jgi:hypothetical protein
LLFRTPIRAIFVNGLPASSKVAAAQFSVSVFFVIRRVGRSEDYRRGRSEAPRKYRGSVAYVPNPGFPAPPGTRHDLGIFPFLSVGRPYYAEKARLISLRSAILVKQFMTRLG